MNAYGAYFFPEGEEAVELFDFSLTILEMFVHNCVDCLDVVAASQEDSGEIVSVFIPCNHFIHGSP